MKILLVFTIVVAVMSLAVFADRPRDQEGNVIDHAGEFLDGGVRDVEKTDLDRALEELQNE